MDTTFATAVHILVLLDSPWGRGMRADPIARSVGTHPVRVRQILARLAAAGYTETIRGRYGGSHVVRPLTDITLADVYALFADRAMLIPVHETADVRCPVGGRVGMALFAPIAEAEAAALEVLRAIPLSTIAHRVRRGGGRRAG
jgi:DNA-binding IscR family transcriptional regulator